MMLREIAPQRKIGQVLQTDPQPTHIIRVLGAAIRDPEQNVRGVVSHANDSEEG
jgi:hypothetical protein